MIQPSLAEIQSGTYTPTLTNGANVSSSTPYVSYFTKIGNIVTVSGAIAITLTTANVSSIIDMSLPIPSNFTVTRQAAGHMSYQSTTIANNGYGFIYSDSTADTVEARFVAGLGATSLQWAFSFTYEIL